MKLYVNRDAAGSADDLPNGSLIVKENYGADERTLMAITVMQWMYSFWFAWFATHPETEVFSRR